MRYQMHCLWRIWAKAEENTELYYRALKAIRSAPPPMPVDIREALGLEIKEEKRLGSTRVGYSDCPFKEDWCRFNTCRMQQTIDAKVLPSAPSVNPRKSHVNQVGRLVSTGRRAQCALAAGCWKTKRRR